MKKEEIIVELNGFFPAIAKYSEQIANFILDKIKSSKFDSHFHNGDQPRVTAKDLIGNPYNIYFTASSNLVASADTERQGEQTSYTKIKEIQVYRDGTITVKFDDKRENASNTVNTALRINGVISGSPYAASTAYTTRSQTINVKAGDLIQAYAVTANAATDYFIKNFRLYYDLTKTNDDQSVIID